MIMVTHSAQSTYRGSTCSQHQMIMLTHSVQNMYASVPGKSLPPVVNTNDNVNASCSKHAHDLKPLDVVLFAKWFFSCSFEGTGILNATDVNGETQLIPLLWNTERLMDKGFSLSCGMWSICVCRRTKLPGRGVHSEIREVGWKPKSQTSEGLIRKVTNRHGTENQSTKHPFYRKPKYQTDRLQEAKVPNWHVTQNQSTKQTCYRKPKSNRHVTENLSHKLVEEEGSAGLAYNYKETNNSTVSIIRQC